MREFIKKKWQGLLRYLKKNKYIKKTWEIIHSYFEKNNYVKKKWKNILGYATAIVLFAVILSQILDRTMLGPVATVWDKSEWASFLGSYIGGIATLAAVCLQISYSRFERREIEEQEKIQRIYKRATVIYYDFMFAFKDITDFFQMCSFATFAKMSQNIADSENIFETYKPMFTQMYIDPQWIQNVAELCEAPEYSSDDIQQIYKIYGALNTVQRWVTSSTTSSQNAVLAIMNLIEYKKDSFVEVEPSPEISELMNKLKATAKIKETVGKKIIPEKDKTNE